MDCATFVQRSLGRNYVEENLEKALPKTKLQLKRQKKQPLNNRFQQKQIQQSGRRKAAAFLCPGSPDSRPAPRMRSPIHNLPNQLSLAIQLYPSRNSR